MRIQSKALAIAISTGVVAAIGAVAFAVWDHFGASESGPVRAFGCVLGLVIFFGGSGLFINLFSDFLDSQPPK